MINFVVCNLYFNKTGKITGKNTTVWMINDLVIPITRFFEGGIEQEVGKWKDRMKIDTLFLEASMHLFHK
jgi:hypothetical protein